MGILSRCQLITLEFDASSFSAYGCTRKHVYDLLSSRGFLLYNLREHFETLDVVLSGGPLSADSASAPNHCDDLVVKGIAPNK